MSAILYSLMSIPLILLANIHWNIDVRTYYSFEDQDSGPNKAIFLDSPSALGIQKVGVTNKTIHLVHHSHNDPGWVYTMAEYEKIISDAELSGGFEYLDEHAKAKFSFTNLAFLYSYIKRHPSIYPVVKNEVDKKRLEILNGGLIMPDQACPSYDDLINNFEYGREWSNKTLGVFPRVAWSIDSFGESLFSSRMFAEMGYDFYGVNRIPVPIRRRLVDNGTILVNWKNPQYSEFDLMTLVLPCHYDTPVPLNFHRRYPEPRPYQIPVMSILSVKFEGLKRALYFYYEVIDRAVNYNADHALLLMGDDFSYGDFKFEMDSFKKFYMMIKMNNKSAFKGLNLVVSSMEEYISSIKSQQDRMPDLNEKDLFPLSNYYHEFDDLAMWVGFYSSRPNFKRTVKSFGLIYRRVMAWLARDLVVTGRKISNYTAIYNTLIPVRFNMAITNHHDAISGTSTEHNILDYYRMLNESAVDLSMFVRAMLPPNQDDSIVLSTEEYYNFTQPIPSTASIEVWNSEIGGLKKIVVRAPAGELTTTLMVSTQRGDTLPVDKLCDVNIGCEYVFWDTFSPFEQRQYTLKVNNAETEPPYLPLKVDGEKTHVNIDGCRLSLSFDGSLLTVEEHCPTHNTSPVKFKVGLFIYDVPLAEMTRFMYTRSGLYMMRTYVDEPKKVILKEGQIYQSDRRIRVTLPSSHFPKQHLHLIYTPREREGRFEVKTSFSKLNAEIETEYVIRYLLDDINNGNHFYSDSNGFYNVKREHLLGKRIEESYYPVTRWIQILGSDKSFSVVNDRSQGGTSPRSGCIELLVNRCGIGNDDLGVMEHFHERYVNLITHTLIFSNSANSESLKKHLVREDQGGLIYFHSRRQLPAVTANRPVNNISWKGDLSFVKTLMDLREDGMMVRIYNLHDSKSITIDNVKEFIKQRYGIERDIEIEERSLDYNLPITTILNQPYAFRNVTALKESYEKETINGGRGALLQSLRIKTYKILNK